MGEMQRGIEVVEFACGNTFVLKVCAKAPSASRSEVVMTRWLRQEPQTRAARQGAPAPGGFTMPALG